MANIKDILGSEYPLVVGAMAHIGDASLGIPTVKAGFGFCMTMTRAYVNQEQWIKEQVNMFRETNLPFGMNLLCANLPSINLVEKAKNLDLDLILRYKPRFVTLSAVTRPKADLVWALKEAGIYVGILVGSARFTELCLRILKGEAQPDFLIAEGRDSGGHIGPENTKNLLKTIVPLAKEIEIPVGIAGGIATRESAVEAFNMKADFIQVGSVAAVCKESPGNPGYKANVFLGTETIVTGGRWMHPVRALKSPFMEKALKLEQDPDTTWEKFSEFAKGSVPRGLLEGDYETGSMLIGTCCKDITRERSIAKIGREILGLDEVGDKCAVP